MFIVTSGGTTSIQNLSNTSSITTLTSNPNSNVTNIGTNNATATVIGSPRPSNNISLISTTAQQSPQQNTKIFTTNPPIISLQSTNQNVQQQIQQGQLSNTSLSQVLRQFSTTNTNININTVSNTVSNSGTSLTSHNTSVVNNQQTTIIPSNSTGDQVISTANTSAGATSTAQAQNTSIEKTNDNNHSNNSSNDNVTFID